MPIRMNWRYLTAAAAVVLFLTCSPHALRAQGMGSTMSLPAGVAASAEQTHPLGVGATLPANLRPATIDGKPFNLNKAVRSKPTVLIFYRGGWCPYCNIQMGQLEALDPKLRALGYQILAISADNPAHLKESLGKHQLTYTLLSDTDMDAAKAFGLAWHVDDATYAQMKNYGVDLEAASGRTDHILPVPAAYVLDRKGVIKFAYANPDFKVRVNPDDLLQAAKAAL